MTSESFETATPAVAAPLARPLPFSLQAEESLIAGCFLDGSTVLVKAQSAGVTIDAFYERKHAILFAVMLDLHAAQKPISIDTVAQELNSSKKLDVAGGYDFLIQVSTRVPTTAEIAYFIEKVMEQFTLRQLIRRAQMLIEECYGFSGDFDDSVMPSLARLQSTITRQKVDRTWTQAVAEGKAATTERMKPPSERVGASSIELSWGLSDFDRFFQPIELGELVVIGGYTSSGKSSLLRQILWNFAHIGHPALMETIETRDVEEAINYAGHISGIRSRGRLNELHHKDQEQLLAAFDTMDVPHFSVCHDDHCVRDIFARAEMFSRKHKLRALGIDYLQLLQDVQRARTSSERAIAIGNVTGACKQFATRQEMAVMLLSGFNREYIRNGNREPILSDLEGGSSIEKDASRVLLIHVPTEYTLKGQKFTQSLTADADQQPTLYVKVIQAKGRNSGTSSVGLMFKRVTKTFTQIAQ